MNVLKLRCRAISAGRSAVRNSFPRKRGSHAACITASAFFLMTVLVCGAVMQAAANFQQPVGSNKPMRIGGEASAPRLISRGKRKIRWPEPPQCYQLGVAVFEGVIDDTGNVRELKLVKGPDNEFTRGRREELLQDRYSPGMYRGKPVDVKMTITIMHVPVKTVNGPC